MFSSPKISFENGNMVRLVDLPLPDNENGIFDLLEEKHGIQSLDLFNQVKNTIESNYGRLIPRWIEFLSKQGKNKIKSFIEEQEWMFLANAGNQQKLRDKKLAPEHMRVCESFAFLAATARLASDYKIIPELYYNTMKHLFGIAVINMMQPQTDILIDIDAFIDFVNVAKNFPLITKGVKISQSKVPNGFRRNDKENEYLYVYPALLEKYSRGNRDTYKRILQEFVRRGAIEKTSPDKYVKTIVQAGLEKQWMLKFRIKEMR